MLPPPLWPKCISFCVPQKPKGTEKKKKRNKKKKKKKKNMNGEDKATKTNKTKTGNKRKTGTASNDASKKQKKMHENASSVLQKEMEQEFAAESATKRTCDRHTDAK